jgi:hypothetical protein
MPTDDTDLRDKSSRGNARQFFIAGELCRRGYSAVVTLGNTPNVDILCSNQKGIRFAHIQVKTFVPGNRTCSVEMKAMKNVGPTFLWATLPLPGKKQDRHQRECREKDWQRELPNIFDEAWRRHARMFGDCFHEQIWRVADVSECAKKGGA